VLYSDQPALEPSPDDPPSGRPVDGQMREVMVPFVDSSWRLVRLVQWRRSEAGWWCLLRWGASGEIVQGWYLADPKRMQPLDGPRS